MFINILNQKIRKDQLSQRAAAREIGIAHTTLQRVLSGKPIDLDTLLKISGYLGIRPETALNTFQENPSYIEDLQLVIESDPHLAEQFKSFIGALKSNEICQADLKDILDYATYKIQSHKESPSN